MKDVLSASGKDLKYLQFVDYCERNLGQGGQHTNLGANFDVIVIVMSGNLLIALLLRPFQVVPSGLQHEVDLFHGWSCLKRYIFAFIWTWNKLVRSPKKSIEKALFESQFWSEIISLHAQESGKIINAQLSGLKKFHQPLKITQKITIHSTEKISATPFKLLGTIS